MVKGWLNTEVLLNWKAEPKQGFGVFKNKRVMSWFLNVGGKGAAAKSLQSCLTLCDPMDCSSPGSSVHGILQARILKCVAKPFSREVAKVLEFQL